MRVSLTTEITLLNTLRKVEKNKKPKKKTLTDTCWGIRFKCSIIWTFYWSWSIECQTTLTTVLYNFSIVIGVFVWSEGGILNLRCLITSHLCKIKMTFIRMEKDTKYLFDNVFWINTLTLPTFTSRQHAHPPCCSTGDSTVTNQSVTNQGIKKKRKKTATLRKIC